MDNVLKCPYCKKPTLYIDSVDFYRRVDVGTEQVPMYTVADMEGAETRLFSGAESLADYNGFHNAEVGGLVVLFRCRGEGCVSDGEIYRIHQHEDGCYTGWDYEIGVDGKPIQTYEERDKDEP